MSVLTLTPTSMIQGWLVVHTSPQRNGWPSRHSWIPSSNSPHGRLRNDVFIHRAGPFFGPEEEFVCPDEEECEIDWDRMPGFEGDDSDANKVNVEEESDVDLQPRPNFGTQALDSLEKGRVHLEMSWQMDECENDSDTCSDFCSDCSGSGKQPCRFCRGTGIVSFGREFRPCLICVHAVVGQETCSSCRGTGKIAPWASTMKDHFKRSEEQSKKFL